MNARCNWFFMLALVALALGTKALPALASSFYQYDPAASGGRGGTAPATGNGCWTVVSSPDPRSSWRLDSVAVVAANDIWAVGYYINNSGANQTLIEHWDGSTWAVVPSPSPGTYDNFLTGVAAVATNDIWAVGYYGSTAFGGPEQTLIEHWNGSTWAIVPGPSTGESSLAGVAALAANDAWAVGTYGGGTLIEHWDGKTWAVVPSPSPSTYSNFLTDVTGIAANDVWAVGYHAGGSDQTLIEHWDGSTWAVVPSPNDGTEANHLLGIARVTANDIWVVGNSRTVDGGGQTLIEHWDGSTWAVVPSPSPGSHESFLRGVAAVAANDIWAVGDQDAGPLTEHWDGSTWAVVPNAGTWPQHLTGVAVGAANDVWAVGGEYGGLVEHYTEGPCPAPTQTPGGPTPTVTRTATPAPGATTTSTPPPGATATATVTLCAVPYTDIAGNPFQTFITNLYCRGVIDNVVDGYLGGQFQPYTDANRGTLARWVVRARGWAIDTNGGPHFTDVPPSDPLYPYVETAYNHAMLSGYADHTFRPTNPVTRGQMSKMIVNAMGWAFDTSAGQIFRDVDGSNPFWNQIETSYAHGLVSGYSCGTGCLEFRWGNNNTRGQLSKVLSNAIGP